MPTQLQNILTAMGLDSTSTLSTFCDAKCEQAFLSIQKFVSTELPDIILEEDRPAYFGIYKSRPQLYKVPEG